jgi:nucleoside-diphosphate-sugar epimerase
MRLKILVTGGAGYIGSHTCKALAAAGYAPVVLDDLSAGHDWAVRWGPLIAGDIADRALVMRTLKRFNVQAIIHFAAHGYVGESVQHPRKYFDNNVSKTLALLDTLLDAGIDKIVFIFVVRDLWNPAWAADCGASSAESNQSVWRVETVRGKHFELVRTGLRTALHQSALFQCSRG